MAFDVQTMCNHLSIKRYLFNKRIETKKVPKTKKPTVSSRFIM